MRARSTARAGHGPVAASAMRWGAPAILTAVTELTDRGPRYRERLAVDLARAGCAFENVAEYLWTGSWLDEALRWRAGLAPAELRALLAAHARLNPGDAHPAAVDRHGPCAPEPPRAAAVSGCALAAPR
ncbi:MAG: hypothetical protein M5U08_00510 [Burkholderiales bacterium]|nr:hypothetical protein [Burkholderiales bacterium]